MPSGRPTREQVDRLRRQATPPDLDGLVGERWRPPGDRYACGEFIADIVESDQTFDGGMAGRDGPPWGLVVIVRMVPHPGEAEWEDRDEYGEVDMNVEVGTGLPLLASHERRREVLKRVMDRLYEPMSQRSDDVPALCAAIEAELIQENDPGEPRFTTRD